MAASYWRRATSPSGSGTSVASGAHTLARYRVLPAAASRARAASAASSKKMEAARSDCLDTGSWKSRKRPMDPKCDRLTTICSAVT